MKNIAYNKQKIALLLLDRFPFSEEILKTIVGETVLVAMERGLYI